MPSPSPMGAPETGQLRLSFAGAIVPVRPRPGPKSKSSDAVLRPANSFPRGGLTATDILTAFGRSQNDLDHTIHLSDSSDDGELARRRKRRPWTKELKLNGIKYAKSTLMPATRTKPERLISIYQASVDLGISTATLRGWIDNVDNILASHKGAKRNRHKNGVRTKGKEMELEARLHTMFEATRARGEGVSYRWFMRKARRIYRELYPERCTKLAKDRGWMYDGFRFSNGWFSGFRRRYDISDRASTKQAQKAPADMREKLEKWCQFNRRTTVIREGSHLGKATKGAGTPCVGRFALSEIGNMNQTPLAFEFLDHRTYNAKGARTVWLKETRSGWDRRQATLQICVFADGEMRCKPQLIFRGAEMGYKARDEERKLYHPGVDVMFNQAAWANDDTMISWLQRIYRPATAYECEV